MIKVNLLKIKIKSFGLKPILNICLGVMFLGIFSNSALAQTNQLMAKPDPRIFDKFEPNYFAEISKNNPSLVLFYNFLLDSSFVILELPKEKCEGLPKISQLTTVKTDLNGNAAKFNENIAEIIQTKKFNVLKYNVVFDDKNRKLYHLDGTNNVIMFYKQSEIREKFKHYKS